MKPFKYLIYFITAMLTCCMGKLQAEDVYSHSYFSGQPITNLFTDMTHSLVMDQYQENGSVLNRPQLSTSVFGGFSTEPDALAKFFLFNGKTSLKMREITDGTGTSDFQQDILGYDFNIQTAQTGNAYASSFISLNPKQTYIGANLNFRTEFKERYWFTFELPLLHIENNLNLTETAIVQSTGTATTNGFDGVAETASSPTTMVQAFKQSGMLYGKIDGVQKKTGIDDIRLKIGYDLLDRATTYMSPFVGVTIPTGNRPNAEYVWEAVVGNNKHFGLQAGAYGHSCLLQNEHSSAQVWLSWSSNNEYLFANTQKRSLDLKQGPWTRYLAMYANSTNRQSTTTTFGTAGLRTFGINLMTQDVTVSPRYSNTSTLALSFIKDGFNLSLGTQTFIRQEEEVKLANPWQVGPQIASFSQANRVNPYRTMGKYLNASAENIATDIYIQESDIDFGSASHPTVWTTKSYLSVAYYAATACPQNYEAGVSYDYSLQNNSINRVGFWGKITFTF